MNKNNEYTINIKCSWLKYIITGQKTVEGRLKYSVFSEIKEGDIICWTNKNLSVRTIVNYIKEYSTFHELLSKEGIKNVLPNITTIEEGRNIYYKYYKQCFEEQKGVIAIGLKLIED